MIYVLLALSAVLTWFTFRAVRRNPSGESVARGLLDFFGTATLGLGAVAVMQLWLDLTARGLDASSTVAWIEKTVRAIRFTYVQPVVIPGWLQLTAVLMLVAGAIIWPHARTVLILSRFRTSTGWVSRVYMFLTIVSLFTFFGPVYAKDAKAVEARFSRQLDEIDRVYGVYYGEVQEAVVSDLAAGIANDPALEDVLPDLEEIAGNVRAEHAEINGAFAEIARYDTAAVRDFRTRADELRARAIEKNVVPGKPAAPAAPAVNREQWSARKGETLRTELRAERVARGTAAADPAAMIGAVANGTLDAAREPAAKLLLSAIVSDPAIRNVLEITLDGVMPGFSGMVAAKVNALFADSVAGGGVRRAWQVHSGAIRAQAASVVQSSAAGVRNALGQAKAAWAARTGAAREANDAVAAEVERKAREQYDRELRSFELAWRTRYAFETEAMQEASLALLRAARRQLDTSAEPPLARVATLRDLRAASGLDDASASRIEALTAFEQKRGLPPSVSYAAEREAAWMMEMEREGKWGGLRRVAYLEMEQRARTDVEAASILRILDGWETAKRGYAQNMVESGGNMDGDAWERAFRDYCERNVRMAVIFGWMVKDTNSSSIEMRYGRAIPENGYRYYLEATGLGGETEARRVFSRSDAIVTINQYCK
jgi:hypothetical protein